VSTRLTLSSTTEQNHQSQLKLKRYHITSTPSPQQNPPLEPKQKPPNHHGHLKPQPPRPDQGVGHHCKNPTTDANNPSRRHNNTITSPTTQPPAPIKSKKDDDPHKDAKKKQRQTNHADDEEQ
jgi:hypothetical protein